MHAAVDLGAGVVPALEDGADRAPELGVRVVGEGRFGGVLDDLLLIGDELAEGGFVEHGVGHAALELGRVEPARVDVEAPSGLEARREEGGVEAGAGHAEDDVGVGDDEAAVGVEGEARVLRGGGDALDDRVVEAEVEDGVHHAGHRGARADRTETRSGADASPNEAPTMAPTRSRSARTPASSSGVSLRPAA